MPALDALVRLRAAGELELTAVVTQPDRAADRRRVRAPVVKERALALGLPVLQPQRLRGAALAELIALRPELLVWAAYGNLVPRALLAAVSGRAVNVHASLLPRWRGAAPVAHAILAGDAETGITLMQGTAELDAGDILAAEATRIADHETAGELTSRLADLGGALLERELPRYLRGELAPRAQPETAVTWAPKLTTADGALDISRPADEIARRVRAMTPEPGAHTSFSGSRLGVRRATVTGGAPKEHGTLELRAGEPHVAAGAGWVRLDVVRPAGKRDMTGAEWVRGVRSLEGARIPS